MKKSLAFLPLLLSTCIATRAASVSPAASAPPASSAILPLLEKNADAQLAFIKGYAPADWTAATFYVGLCALSHTSTNPQYAKAAFDIAEKNHWQIHNEMHGATARRFFADDQCIGQLYIDLAAGSHNLHLLDPLIAEESALAAHLLQPAPASQPSKLQPIPWWWCDALFMNPPVLARLSAVTGDPQFLNAMDHAYWQTYDLLYDKGEHLFYRDNRFLGQKSKNGKKIFWSRGDGRVLGGLCQALTYMPQDYPSRAKYLTLFKDMTAKIVTLQNDDGLWLPTLLDRAAYLPATEKAWAGLTSKLRPDGQLGFVQPVGYKPESAQPLTLANTHYYGNGAFLLAGCELLKLHNEASPMK